jgi:hypothetical protein
MAANPINPFYDLHVDILWSALTGEFGRDVNFWPGGDDTLSVAIEVIWPEGVEDEEVAPGRYSHVFIRDNSLPLPPALGDALEANGVIYDLVRVNALAFAYSTVVLQERG